MWYVEDVGNAVDHFTPNGAPTFTRVGLNGPNVRATFATFGGDGGLWVSEARTTDGSGNTSGAPAGLARVDATGSGNAFSLFTLNVANPEGIITTASDGSVWFVDNAGALGKIGF